MILEFEFGALSESAFSCDAQPPLYDLLMDFWACTHISRTRFCIVSIQSGTSPTFKLRRPPFC
eukprot:15134704-Alexandrium_andersonii.AAC.1